LLSARDMMRTSSLLALSIGSMLLACGGASGTSIIGDGTDPGGSGGGGGSGGSGSGSKTVLGGGGAVVDNGGTVQFSVSEERLERYPNVGIGDCDDNPYTANDSYDLIAYGPASLAPRPQLEINIPAHVAIGTAQSLQVIPWKLEPVPPPQDNYTNQEEAANEQTLLGVSLGRGADPSTPDQNAFDQATLTIVSVPTAPGEVLTVRVQLHFVDGKTLDQTLSSPPARAVDPACAAGGATNAM
jgi:hypothetical protein